MSLSVAPITLRTAISFRRCWMVEDEIEKNYFNKYGPTMNGDGSFRSDNIVLSEQNSLILLDLCYLIRIFSQINA